MKEPAAMKAIVYTQYGSPDVLRLIEVATPAPKDNEVLIRVRAAAVNPLDWHLMRGEPRIARLVFGPIKPRDTRPGRDVAGEVVEVGKNVTHFKPGDAVFGVCRGAFAEYACALESRLVTKPDNVTFEQAAAVPVAALTALQGLRDRGRIRNGHKVLINGAAGGVGSFAVQIAESFGADVTGVCSTGNVDRVRAIGAHHVIDYTREDFTRSGQRYDVVFDAVGNRSLADCRRAMTSNGALVLAGASDEILRAIVLSWFSRQRLRPFLARVRKDDLLTLRELLATGAIVPVIDRTYPLSDVPAAVRYSEEGHARGKLVITIEHAGDH
jgi:2-desacetyl-2-hydroxyethyl bacteriochlorophyllide A dehydrogenase